MGKLPKKPASSKSRSQTGSKHLNGRELMRVMVQFNCRMEDLIAKSELSRGTIDNLRQNRHPASYSTLKRLETALREIGATDEHLKRIGIIEADPVTEVDVARRQVAARGEQDHAHRASITEEELRRACRQYLEKVRAQVADVSHFPDMDIRVIRRDSTLPAKWRDDWLRWKESCASQKSRRGAIGAVVTGLSGFGKSWLLRQEALLAAEKGLGELENPNCPLDHVSIPVLCDLREISRDVTVGNFSNVVRRAALGRLGLLGETSVGTLLKNRLGSANSILLLDTWDQSPNDDKRAIINDALFSWVCNHPNGCLLVMSQPFGLKFASIASSIGLDQSAEWQLQPWNEDQVVKYVDHVLGDNTEPKLHAQKLLDTTPGTAFYETPLHLRILCDYCKHLTSERDRDRTRQPNAARLFEWILEAHFSEPWRSLRPWSGPLTAFSSEVNERSQYLRGLAFAVSERGLEDFHPSAIVKDRRRIAGKTPEKWCTDAGILVPAENRPNYRFRNRHLREFLAGGALAGHQDAKEIILRRARMPEWEPILKSALLSAGETSDANVIQLAEWIVRAGNPGVIASAIQQGLTLPASADWLCVLCQFLQHRSSVDELRFAAPGMSENLPSGIQELVTRGQKVLTQVADIWKDMFVRERRDSRWLYPAWEVLNRLPSGLGQSVRDGFSAELGLLLNDAEDAHGEVANEMLRQFVDISQLLKRRRGTVEVSASTITNVQFELMDPGFRRSKYSADDDCPAIVSGHQAQMFAQWLGPDFRLPRWSEFVSLWMLLADGVEKLTSAELQRHGWFAPESRERAQPVRSKPAVNGLFGLVGNVWQWCAGENEAEPSSCAGGSWEIPGLPQLIREPLPRDPRLTNGVTGFRLIREQSPARLRSSLRS